MDGRTPRVGLDVTWIVPGELYAVYRDNTEYRIAAGEIHATTLDGDEIPVGVGEGGLHFPSRYRKGLYSARRAWGHKLVDLDHFDPERKGQFERRADVLEARREKLTRWQKATRELINLHLELIRASREWAERARNSQTQSGAYALVTRLEQVRCRPFNFAFKRIVNDLHTGNPDNVLAYCDITTERHRLESLMSLVSEAVERVGRHKEDPSVTIGRIFPQPTRQTHAQTLRTAITALGMAGAQIETDLARPIRTLEAACDELETGTLRNTKTILSDALIGLDHALRI
ncbi:MAG: hypothetical protein QG626_52 [Patescibacteria group bacterium]|nr:hypothetical protein [Patescibacteria group bacterium]